MASSNTSMHRWPATNLLLVSLPLRECMGRPDSAPRASMLSANGRILPGTGALMVQPPVNGTPDAQHN